jgi:hypothetical protein
MGWRDDEEQQAALGVWIIDLVWRDPGLLTLWGATEDENETDKVLHAGGRLYLFQSAEALQRYVAQSPGIVPDYPQRDRLLAEIAAPIPEEIAVTEVDLEDAWLRLEARERISWSRSQRDSTLNAMNMLYDFVVTLQDPLLSAFKGGATGRLMDGFLFFPAPGQQLPPDPRLDGELAALRRWLAERVVVIEG